MAAEKSGGNRYRILPGERVEIACFTTYSEAFDNDFCFWEVATDFETVFTAHRELEYGHFGATVIFKLDQPIVLRGFSILYFRINKTHLVRVP